MPVGGSGVSIPCRDCGRGEMMEDVHTRHTCSTEPVSPMLPGSGSGQLPLECSTGEIAPCNTDAMAVSVCSVCVCTVVVNLLPELLLPVTGVLHERSEGKPLQMPDNTCK